MCAEVRTEEAETPWGVLEKCTKGSELQLEVQQEIQKMAVLEKLLDLKYMDQQQEHMDT